MSTTAKGSRINWYYNFNEFQKTVRGKKDQGFEVPRSTLFHIKFICKEDEARVLGTPVIHKFSKQPTG